MTVGFQILPGEDIQSGQIVTAPPEIYPDWAAGTFNTGDTVVREEQVYEAQSDGVTSDPLIGVGAQPAEWVLIGPSNRTAPFDGQNSTQAVRTDGNDLVFRITPTSFFTLASVAGVFGASVTFTHYDASGNVKETASPSVFDFEGRDTFWNIFFTPWEVRTTFNFGPLVPLIGDLEVRVAPSGGEARIGEIIVGRARILGLTSPQVDRRYIDNSSYATNIFGDVDITRRDGVPERNFQITLDSAGVPSAERVLADNNGRRCAFIPNENTPDLVTVGYLSNWRFRESVMWDETTGQREGHAVLELQTRGIR